MPFKSEEQRKWMHQNLPDIADRWEKEYEGGGKLEGKLQGPSHEMGGIKFNLGGEIQEAEGGEYVVRKDSVNKDTENVLKYINENGKLPNQMESGGLIKDARNRRNK